MILPILFVIIVFAVVFIALGINAKHEIIRENGKIIGVRSKVGGKSGKNKMRKKTAKNI